VAAVVVAAVTSVQTVRIGHSGAQATFTPASEASAEQYNRGGSYQFPPESRHLTTE
jgi:hypothetical protein